MWIRLDASSGEGYLYYITVAPDCRRQGYASAAVNTVAYLARSKRLYSVCPQCLRAQQDGSVLV